MPRHLTSDDLAVQDEGVAVSSEEVWRFEGAGVSAADDAGNSRTLVTVAGGAGGGAPGYGQQFFYNPLFTLSDVSPLTTVDFGAIYDAPPEVIYGTPFIDPASDATIGEFVFAETGLYQITASMGMIDSADDFDTVSKRVSLEADIYGDPGRPPSTYYAPTEAYYGNSFGQVAWRCNLDFTDVIVAGDTLAVVARVSDDYVATGFEAYINIAKLV